MLPHSTTHPDPVAPIPTVVPTPPSFQEVSEDGYRALWVGFVVMVLASAVFTGLAWRIPMSKRVFHVITTLITVVAGMSYLAMATGQGSTFKCITVTEHHHKHIPDTHHLECREVFWARYVDWAITTPLLLLDLSLLAGLSGGNTLVVIASDLVMVFSGLFAAFGKEHNPNSKWAWYAISCIAFIVLVSNLAYQGSKTIRAKGTKARALFGSLGLFTLILWTAYPIVWGFADGARRASVDTEVIAYSVLDILAKPIFGIWLLLAYRSVPECQVELGGYWAHGLNQEGTIRLTADGDEGA